MRWPWISRAAYDLLERELERLREQNDGLVDQLTRIRRRDEGLSELPREVKPVKAKGPVPEDIREYVEGFDARPVRMDLYQQIEAARATMTWDQMRDHFSLVE